MFRLSTVLPITSILSLAFSIPISAQADNQPRLNSGAKVDVVKTKGDDMLQPPQEQFDFLIGKWAVDAKTFQAGKVVAETQAVWNAKYSDDKKIVIDEWRSVPNENGQSQLWITLRSYSESMQRWQIVGLQSNQPTLAPTFLGEWRNGEMHMWAEIMVEQGPLQARVRFYHITENSFEWEMKMSIDGEAWFLYQTFSARRIR